MKKIVRLTENQLTEMVKRIAKKKGLIKEDFDPDTQLHYSGDHYDIFIGSNWVDSDDHIANVAKKIKKLISKGEDIDDIIVFNSQAKPEPRADSAQKVLDYLKRNG